MLLAEAHRGANGASAAVPRKNGGGFKQLERWLGSYDILFLRRNNVDPMILLPWRVWAQLLAKVQR